MQIMQTRRDFLASAVSGRRRGRPWRPGIARRRGAAGDDHDPARAKCIPQHLRSARIRRRGAAARGRLHRRPLRGDEAAPVRSGSRAARSISTDVRGADRRRLDAGVPITVLAGVHAGCFELFAQRAASAASRDLKGKKRRRPRGARLEPASVLAIMAAHVGLDPEHGHRVGHEPTIGDADGSCSSSGKIDAFLGFPPEPQELRARKIGRVIVNTAVDRPWSQYFCCMLAGSAEFVREHPVATKRVLRAHAQGRRPVRCGAGACRAAAGRGRVRPELRLRAPDADASCPTTAGASSTPRTRCGSTRSGSTRSGMITSSPNAAHRRRHRLAFSRTSSSAS